MADSFPRSALAEVWRRGRYGAADRDAGIELVERLQLDMLEVASFRSGAEQVAATITAALGVELPSDPNRVVTRGNLALFPTGPGRWLIVTRDAEGSLESRLRHPLEYVAAVTELGNSRCVIRMTGVGTRTLLAKGCSLALQHRAFPAGTFAQTQIARLAVLVHAVDRSVFDIYVARSYAVHFWEWLTHAAEEFGYVVGQQTWPERRIEHPTAAAN